MNSIQAAIWLSFSVLQKNQPWIVWFMNCAEQAYSYFDYLYYCSLWKGLALTSAPLCWKLHRETRWWLWPLNSMKVWAEKTWSRRLMRESIHRQCRQIKNNSKYPGFPCCACFRKSLQRDAVFVHWWQWTFLHWFARGTLKENGCGFVIFVDYKLSVWAARLLQIIFSYLGKRET